MVSLAAWNKAVSARSAAKALAAGGCAYVGAFVADAPALLLVAPVVALVVSETRSSRIAVSVLTHLSLWSPLPDMAVTYGVPPLYAWAGISALMMVQATVVGFLPPALGVTLWAISPLGFGHPVFGVFSVMPFLWMGPVAGLFVGAVILVGMTNRRTLGVAILCLTVLGFTSTAPADPAVRSPLVPMSTAFTMRSVFPVDDWSDISGKLANAEGSGPWLLPEGTIGEDIERGFDFFRQLARARGEDLLVGVSDVDGEMIVVFSANGSFETVYRQLQGVPVINDGLAAPWQFFSGRAVELHGERIAFAICFEAFLPLTWASAMLSNSTTVAVVSNDRWNSAPVRNAQAKLFSFPWPATVVVASNAPEL